MTISISQYFVFRIVNSNKNIITMQIKNMLINMNKNENTSQNESN
jgi:hypothetical protein